MIYIIIFIIVMILTTQENMTLDRHIFHGDLIAIHNRQYPRLKITFSF